MSEIRAYTAARPIAPVKASREALMERHFSTQEQASLTTRPAQTIAGRLALKAAVAELLDKNGICELSSATEIEIGQTRAGGPVLQSIAGLDRTALSAIKGRLHLSITHSRHQAVGLAVWQAAEAEDE